MRRGAYLISIVVALLSSLLLVTCKSAPDEAPPPVPPSSPWAISPPEDTDRRLHFVASGDSVGTAADGIAEAIIARFSLGAEARRDTAAVSELRERLAAATKAGAQAHSTAGASRDFEVEISEGRVHFEVRVERHERARVRGGATHWLHVSVARDAFEAAELELARLVPGANPGPPLERRAREKAASGRVVEALRDYERAIRETADTPYAEQTAETSTRAARELLERIELVVERDGVESRIGQPFDDTLIVSVVDTRSGRKMSDMPVTISYPVYDEQGNVERRTHYGHSSRDGRVSFEPPTPEVRGTYTVSMAPAPFSAQAPMNTPSGSVAELIQRARRRGVVLEYSVYSLAREVPTGVFIVDTDIAGNPTGTQSTQRGLLLDLEERDFTVSSLRLGADRFLRLDDRDRWNLIRQRFGEDFERVVIGTASIAEFEESQNVSVEVEGDLRALDLDSGEVLYRKRLVQRSRANTASGAITVAFRGLGAKFAQELAARLP